MLVGAGDIADCGEDGDEATAELIESIPGTVFTLGDNAYENGTPRDFQDCYGPTWGRASIKDRTRPVAGNHDYRHEGSRGLLRSISARPRAIPSEGWYAYDAGAWRIYVLNSNCNEIGGCGPGQRRSAGSGTTSRRIQGPASPRCGTTRDSARARSTAATR